MGYKSKVSLTMKKEDIIELLKRAAAKNANNDASAYLRVDKILDHKDGYASLYWDWSEKWDFPRARYYECENIALVKNYIAESIRNRKDVSYKCIGEDDDDYEFECKGKEVCDKVRFVRELDLSGGDVVSEEGLV